MTLELGDDADREIGGKPAQHDLDTALGAAVSRRSRKDEERSHCLRRRLRGRACRGRRRDGRRPVFADERGLSRDCRLSQPEQGHRNLCSAFLRMPPEHAQSAAPYNPKPRRARVIHGQERYSACGEASAGEWSEREICGSCRVIRPAREWGPPDSETDRPKWIGKLDQCYIIRIVGIVRAWEPMPRWWLPEQKARRWSSVLLACAIRQQIEGVQHWTG